MTFDIAEIKRRADLERVAEELGLQPKKAGRSLVCRCPAHKDEGRPNLALSQTKGVFCFRCGFKGDVIALVAKAKNVDTGEAIKWLADFANVKGATPKKTTSTKKAMSTAKGRPKAQDRPFTGPYMPPTAPQKASGPQSAPKATKWPLTMIWPPGTSAGLIHGQWRRLPSGEIEATYKDRDELSIALRFVDDGDIGSPDWKPTRRAEIYDAFLSHCRPATDLTPGAIWLRDQKAISVDTQARLGVVWLEDWGKIADDLKTRFSVEDLDLVGVMTRDRKTTKPIDLRFKNHRLIFPFFVTVDGRRSAIYLQARNIGATDKRERFDNPTGSVPAPYNVDAIEDARRLSKPVFIAEGVSDTLTLSQANYFAVGIVGSQGFKADWVKAFDGLDVYVAGDGDEAGRDFNRKVAKAFVDLGRPSPKVVALPDGQDVTDVFTKQRSKEVKS